MNGYRLRGQKPGLEQKQALKQPASIFEKRKQQQEPQRFSQAKKGARSEAERPPASSPPPGQRASLNVCLAILRSKDFRLASALHTTHTPLSSDINSSFKERKKQASVVGARGPQQWAGRGCQRS